MVRAAINSIRYSALALLLMLVVGSGLTYITSRRKMPDLNSFCLLYE